MKNQIPKLRIINGVPYASSLDIANRFAVAHKNILAAVGNRIRRLTLQPATAEFVSRHFTESEYLLSGCPFSILLGRSHAGRWIGPQV